MPWGSPLALYPVRWAGRGLLLLLFSMGTECHNRERGAREERGEALLLPPGPTGRSHSARTKQTFPQTGLFRVRGDCDPCLLVHLHFLLMRVAETWRGRLVYLLDVRN